MDLALTRSQSSLGHIGLAQSADHQKNAHIGSSIVDSNRCARDRNVPLRAGGHVDIVVSGSIVTDVPQGLGQHGEQFGIEGAGELAIL